MKVFRKPIFKKILAHFLFCAIMLYFFGFNCRLRPVAFPAVYKEYIAGVFAIITIYLNYLVLFPKLYTCRRYKEYWLYTIGSVVLSSFLEMLLVYPQLCSIYINRYNRPEMIEALTMDFLYVTIRNGGLTLFAYTINEIRWLKKQTEEKDSLVREKYDSLDVKDKKHQTLFILTGNIYYCEQDRNISVIHLLDGKHYVRYCSMGSLENLLGDKEFIRISRNVIVPVCMVLKCNGNDLWLKKTVYTTESPKFRISDTYLSQVVNQLELRMPQRNTRTAQDIPPTVDLVKKDQPNLHDLLEECNHNPKLLTIYHYIFAHPNCKIGDICNSSKLSKGSVCRYLAKLTDLEVIRYNGAKKNGGYSIVSQD